MPSLTPEQIAERRRLEDILLKLGQERAALEHQTTMNYQKIRAVLKPAREADITVRDISRLTGLSTQTLHAWHQEIMRPIPGVRFGLGGPLPGDLTESVLRTMGEDPKRDWTASDVRDAILAHWPRGSVHEIQLALGMLARSLQIWQTDDGYRIEPPDDIDTLTGGNV